jgi:hypothetical protein
MLGNFQSSRLRIEVKASGEFIHHYLNDRDKLKQWLWSLHLADNLPEHLDQHTTFTTKFGPLAIDHKITIATDHCLRSMLSKAIDGYQEWYWGDNWVQSSLEGVSLMPLSWIQTTQLMALKRCVEKAASQQTKDSTD